MIHKLFFKRSNSGFTLIELITVLVLVGILAAIAGPSWLGFANNRRANAGRDQVLQVLRQAQAEAVRTRQTHIVQFDPTANPPAITLQTVGTPPRSQSYQLGDTAGIQPDYLGMRITNGSTVQNICANTNCIAFDARGAVLNAVQEAQPIYITVFAPRNTPSTRRCVIIRTLLGAMQSAQGNTCQ